MGFDSSKKQLKDWLRRIHEGQLQLPDFQRGWVWSDEAIRSLVASIANGYPVGALLTLETGGAVQFKPRLVEGVPPQPAQPEACQRATGAAERPRRSKRAGRDRRRGARRRADRLGPDEPRAHPPGR